MTKKVKIEKTPLHKEFAKLRIDHEISRAQMARELKITDSQLAKIESGKADVTDAFLQLVSDRFSLIGLGNNCDLIYQLREALTNSIERVEFNMVKLTELQRTRVMFLKRAIENEIAAMAKLAKQLRVSKKGITAVTPPLGVVFEKEVLALDAPTTEGTSCHTSEKKTNSDVLEFDIDKNPCLDIDLGMDENGNYRVR